MKAISISELDSLSKIDLRIPRYVQAGDSADLVCSYYLDSHNLYSVKWYKGRHEFYRFMPQEIPPVKVFPVKGMKINVSIFISEITSWLTTSVFERIETFQSWLTPFDFTWIINRCLIANASCTILLSYNMTDKYLFNISWPCTINLTLFCFGKVQKNFQNQAVQNS